jgi:tape measure domain-containing protein
MRRAGVVMDEAARKIERRFTQTERRVNSSFNNMARAGVAAFAVFAAARFASRVVGDLIRVSDTYQGLQNQVNSATEAVGRSLATMEEIADVARSSRTSLEGTTMLYTRLARATAHLNVSQEDTLRMTELVGMSFAASGATIQEQRSSILQLSQALQSGFLQGDELRSLREGAPEIARAIAAEMNVGIGALKELGAQGLITTDVVMNAVLNAGQTIEGQFDRTHATVAQAMNNLRTAFSMAVGSSEEAGGATGELAQAIIDLADVIDENQEGIASFVDLVGNLAEYGVQAAGGIGNLFGNITTGIDRLQRTRGGTETFRPVTEEEFATEMASVRNATSSLRELSSGEMLGQMRANQLIDAIGPDLLNAEEMALGAYTRANGQLIQSLITALDMRLGDLQIGLNNLNATDATREDFLAQRGIGPLVDDRRAEQQRRDNAAEAARLAREREILAGPDADVVPRFAPRYDRDARMREEEAARLEEIQAGKDEALLQFNRVVNDTLAEAKDTAYDLGVEQARAFDEELKDRRAQFSETFGNVFAQGMMEAFDGNLLQFIQRQLQEAMFNAMSNAFARVGEQLFDGLFSNGGGGGILGSIFSSAIGGGKFPGKAIGGPVRAGQPYIVGEHKPELFIPDQAGRIVPQLPSGAASAMITYSPTYAIDARGSTPDAIAALRREMLATRQADMQQFGTRVRGVLPGALASAQRDGAV